MSEAMQALREGIVARPAKSSGTVNVIRNKPDSIKLGLPIHILVDEINAKALVQCHAELGDLGKNIDKWKAGLHAGNRVQMDVSRDEPFSDHGNHFYGRGFEIDPIMSPDSIYGLDYDGKIIIEIDQT